MDTKKLKFDQIDLSSITLDDLKEIKNGKLRDALIELVKSPESLVASGHQNHGSHTNHGTDASKFIDLELKMNPASKK
jgi:hypothetical protein